MTHRANIIGAVLASFAFLIVIFAGTLGQLFTMSGAVNRIPAYGTQAMPNARDVGYADPLVYDEEGVLIDFRKVAGHVVESAASDTGTCSNRTYILELKERKVWIKGSAAAAVEALLRSKIQPSIESCSVPAGKDFSCAAGCEVRGEDEIIKAKPLTLTLQSANAAALGILQYVHAVNAGCIRIRQCSLVSQ